MPSAWEILKINIDDGSENLPENNVAVMIPHTGDTSIEWASKFRHLVFPDNTQIFFARGLPIDITRDNLVNKAVEDGFKYVFFLDSDVIPPSDAVERLINRNCDIVSGIYTAKKTDGLYWSAWIQLPDKNGMSPAVDFDIELAEVDCVGTGCLLIKTSVLIDIRSKTNLPFFFWSKDRDRYTISQLHTPDPRMDNVSEDFWFCLLAKQYGHKIYVDSTIRCTHVFDGKLVEKKVVM